eukprot:7824-Heterococcus_DN1.PRE.1
MAPPSLDTIGSSSSSSGSRRKPSLITLQTSAATKAQSSSQPLFRAPISSTTSTSSSSTTAAVLPPKAPSRDAHSQHRGARPQRRYSGDNGLANGNGNRQHICNFSDVSTSSCIVTSESDSQPLQRVVSKLHSNDLLSSDWHMLMYAACLSRISNSTNSGSGSGSSIDMDLLAQAFSYAASLEEQQASLSAGARRHSSSSSSSSISSGAQRSKSSGATATVKTLGATRARSGSSSRSSNTVAGAYTTAKTASHSSSHGRLRVPRNRAVVATASGTANSLQPAWDSGGGVSDVSSLQEPLPLPNARRRQQNTSANKLLYDALCKRTQTTLTSDYAYKNVY